MHMKNLVPLVAGLALAAGIQGESLATPPTTAVPGFVAQPAPPPAAGPKHTFLYTYAKAGIGGAVTALTFTDVDHVKVKCNQPTCLLEISIMEQATFADDATKPWAIPVWVDGNSVDGGPYVGTLPSFAVMGNWQGSYAVTEGSHTVLFQTYGQANYSIGHWADAVTVTTP
jgi:hypothetical protein